MSQAEHSAILGRAAKAALTPLGFRQRGRSRVWLADRSYWLCVVEFQPSGFSKGAYLNTSAHWLWRPTENLTFDYMLSDMQRPFISFESAEQFGPLAAGLAALAASESKRLENRLASFEDVARLLVESNKEYSAFPNRPHGGWQALHAAIAMGVLGHSDAATVLLQTFLDGRYADYLGAWPYSAKQALADGVFDEFIKRTIHEARERYRLPPWQGDFAAGFS